MVPAVRILYVNAAIVMTAKVFILYFWSSETEVGRARLEQTRGVSIWRLLREYRGVLGLIIHSKGTIFSLAIMAVVSAVVLINGTFWQIVISQRLNVPDPLLPFFPMVRSILSVIFFFTLIPRLTAGPDLRITLCTAIVTIPEGCQYAPDPLPQGIDGSIAARVLQGAA